MDFGHPPPNMHMPPPIMGPPMMGPPGRPNIRHNFRPYHQPYQLRFPPTGPLNMTQDDFDGKRLRKSVMRKTVDYNAAIIKALECRVWQRDWRDRHALQPDAMYMPDLLPPPSYPDNPINAVTTKFVKTATNKMRCPIFALAWTPEGRRLVTGASSGEFTLWNGLTFNFETILQAHDSPVRSMVWSHGEGWMVTGDHSGYVKYWQSNMNNVKMFQAHKEAVRGISFSPTDAKIVTCSDDGTLRIFDFYRYQEERILRGHGADVKCVHWHPTKALIVSGSKDNQQPIKLWDPKSGQALSTLHAHKSTVMDLKWNENGNWLITASRDHLLKLFDIRKMGTEVQIFRGHKKEAASVAWHPCHEGLFCSGGSDGSILFWNVGTDKEVGCIEGAHESIVWTMAWHPLGHILCSGSNDHTSKFWTRNRPGDQMRDKYNLNTLPPGVSEDQELDEPSSVIPGMGPEDKIEIFLSEKDTEKAIPGLDLDTCAIPLDILEKKIKKVPYSKPIPRNFQAQWNHGPTGDEVSPAALTQALAESLPGAVHCQSLSPSSVYIYNRLIPVEPGSDLEKAINSGPIELRKYIASGAIESLEDVIPYIESDENDDVYVQNMYPDHCDLTDLFNTENLNDNDEEMEENRKPKKQKKKRQSKYDDDNEKYPQDNYGDDYSEDMSFGGNDYRDNNYNDDNKYDDDEMLSSGPPHSMNNIGPQMGNMGPPMMPMGMMGPPIGPPMGLDGMGPPMGNMGPPIGNRGPPMNNMGPPMTNMGPPMNNMGPPMNNMGPPMNNMGPPMNNMGPPMGGMGPPPLIAKTWEPDNEIYDDNDYRDGHDYGLIVNEEDGYNDEMQANANENYQQTSNWSGGYRHGQVDRDRGRGRGHSDRRNRSNGMSRGSRGTPRSRSRGRGRRRSGRNS